MTRRQRIALAMLAGGVTCAVCISTYFAQDERDRNRVSVLNVLDAGLLVIDLFFAMFIAREIQIEREDMALPVVPLPGSEEELPPLPVVPMPMPEGFVRQAEAAQIEGIPRDRIIEVHL